MDYLLAVDGGGTKTSFVLYNIKNDCAELMSFGASNHEFLAGGYNEMRSTLDDMSSRILKKHGLSRKDIAHSVWGLAGLDTATQYKIIHKFISEFGFKKFTLCNDSYLGIKAGIPQGCGICMISGTGFKVAGINEMKSSYEIGGFFEITGDFGGGLILGKETIKTTYMNLFRHRRQTILSKNIMELYQVQSRHEFMDRVTDWADSGKMPIPSLAKCIFDAANLGDEESIKILERMAHEYALSVKSLLYELPFNEKIINIVLIGSLFTKNWSNIHLQALKAKLKDEIGEKQFELELLSHPPVLGALSWVLEEAGISEPWSKANAALDKIY